MADRRFAVPGPSGLTVSLTIKRASDNFFWTGSAWQSASATVAMTWDSDLELYISTTAPTARCFYTGSSSTGILLGYGEYDPNIGAAATSSTIAPTLADLKEYLQISDSSDDTFLTNATNRAGEYIEDYCGRRFASSARTYVLNGEGNERLYLPDWPITGITSIYGSCPHYPRHFTSTGGSVQTTELVDSDYYFIANIGGIDEAKDHILNIASGSPYATSMGIWDLGQQNYEVVATTGYATIPANLYQASIEVAAIIYKGGKHGELGKTTMSFDGGSSGYELEKGMPKGTLDVLNRYRNKG